MPPLQAFEERITHLRALEDEVRELPGTHVVGWLKIDVRELPGTHVVGWLKIDVRPLRHSLLTCVSRWREVVQDFPLNHVIATLAELLTYCATTSVSLETDVFDPASLEVVLIAQRALRRRERATDMCFEPLRITIAMLSRYAVIIPEEAPAAAEPLRITIAMLSRYAVIIPEEAPAAAEPLGITIAMLSRYAVIIPEEVPRDFELAQKAWAALKQKALLIKSRHQDVQDKEAAALKSRSTMFAKKISDFREAFLAVLVAMAFLAVVPLKFSDEVESAYPVLDGVYHGAGDAGTVRSALASDFRTFKIDRGGLAALGVEGVRLNELQASFELEVADYSVVGTCVEEAALLKTIWDSVALVEETYAEWRKIPWGSVEVTVLREENRTLALHVEQIQEVAETPSGPLSPTLQSIKETAGREGGGSKAEVLRVSSTDSMLKKKPGPSKEAYPVYNTLCEVVRDMDQSLPLIDKLLDPAIRKRHWKQLMRATGVSFDSDSDKFCLGDLLVLRLHEHSKVP
ncbi:hypothetical protein T484DRAFT_1766402 [Baffinella frigidus]|nr:hypothetical protein T484DRAFT_1766402 [Cryptophyta sp. CCMP2293]